jgi:hypothetical protein
VSAVLEKLMAATQRTCELDNELLPYMPLYWYLEYWGDWARQNGPRGMSVLERLGKFGDEYMPPGTANDGFPLTIELIEKALAQLRLHDRFKWRLIVAVHIAKTSFMEIGSGYGMRRRGVRRTLAGAYQATQAELLRLDHNFFAKPAPTYSPC